MMLDRLKVLSLTLLRFAASFTAVLALFGLLLGLAWPLVSSISPQASAAAAIVSAGLAFAGGSYLASRLSHTDHLSIGLAFGLVFGGCSASYLFIGSPFFLTALGWFLLASIGGSWLAIRRS